jgi:hypothetical protein
VSRPKPRIFAVEGNSLLLGCEHPVPISRRGLDLEPCDAPPVEIVNGGEEASRGEPSIVEQSHCSDPILPARGSQQLGVPVDKLVLGNAFRRQNLDAAGLRLAFNRDDILFDQRRITEAPGRLLAGHQIDAIDFAEAFQPRS